MAKDTVATIVGESDTVWIFDGGKTVPKDQEGTGWVRVGSAESKLRAAPGAAPKQAARSEAGPQSINGRAAPPPTQLWDAYVPCAGVPSLTVVVTADARSAADFIQKHWTLGSKRTVCWHEGVTPGRKITRRYNG